MRNGLWFRFIVPLSKLFQLYRGCFIDGGHRSTRRKSQTWRKSLTKQMLYRGNVLLVRLAFYEGDYCTTKYLMKQKQKKYFKLREILTFWLHHWQILGEVHFVCPIFIPPHTCMYIVHLFIQGFTMVQQNIILFGHHLNFQEDRCYHFEEIYHQYW